MSTRRNLQLSRLGLSKNRVGRVAEVSDQVGRWHQFEQQLKALSGRFGRRQETDAGDISASSIEPVDEANPDGVGTLHKNDRARLGRCFGG
jgi:hypothetical protein